jgi:hypothetical protein
MTNFPQPLSNTRIGFHYFPDTVHYRESDLHAWLPELRSLGASWVILSASIDRAIPEFFISGLAQAGIEPVLHFQFSPDELIHTEEMSLFFSSYAKWGVHYVTFFDRPNSRRSWSPASWAQEELVERFVDRFIPLANAAVQAGLTPVFPPLEPGGDYWDTAFLSTALTSLQRRKQTTLLENLALAAYGWTGEHSLRWGTGGPERWPGSRPYFTPANEEDQRVFRIFDWYAAISRAILGQACPIILMAAGSPLDNQIPSSPLASPLIHAQTELSIARLMAGETVPDPEDPEVNLDAVTPAVLGCCFWLLATSVSSPYASQAWFQANGQTLPAVGAFRQWVNSRPVRPEPAAPGSDTPAGKVFHPSIDHYLLLPTYDWGVADWHLEVIRPFVKKHHPTIGFSLEEAGHASHVTIIGSEQVFPEDAVNKLRASGCFVERISGDGTQIATLLAER